ncbi:hypothetical protein JOD24_002587 [Kroppenstedtia sanguinis]
MRGKPSREWPDFWEEIKGRVRKSFSWLRRGKHLKIKTRFNDGDVKTGGSEPVFFDGPAQ